MYSYNLFLDIQCASSYHINIDFYCLSMIQYI